MTKCHIQCFGKDFVLIKLNSNNNKKKIDYVS